MIKNQLICIKLTIFFFINFKEQSKINMILNKTQIFECHLNFFNLT